MTSFAGLPLVVCGTLKIAYDLALLFSFRHIKPPEEKHPDQWFMLRDAVL